jgi:hypothetical protein
MVEFAATISIRVKDTIINDPKLSGVGIDIDTADNAYALDNLFSLPLHCRRTSSIAKEWRLSKTVSSNRM